ncbi:MAG TPA: hypothetical protein VKV26_07180 [Dehalococcoidia bacterium]|nr:hypothetical protein [Dehalococcoidia bacterium]
MTPRAASPTPAVTTMRPSVAGGRGAGPYRLFDEPGYELPDGPTHQPGVMPGRHHEPLRTPFGDAGVPGTGRERNVTDLDLHRNRHRTGRRR